MITPTFFFGTYLQAAVGIDTQIIYHKDKSEELLNRAMELHRTADDSKYTSFLLSQSVYKHACQKEFQKHITKAELVL